MSEQAKKWFLLKNGQVTGPLTLGEAEAQAAQNAAVSDLALWGRGLPEWLPPTEWRQALERLGPAVTESTPHEAPQWRYRLGGAEHGPFAYPELIAELKKHSDFNDIEITGEGFNGWKEIYGVQRIVDEMGITRRAHPRVPIMGVLKIQEPKGIPDAKVVTISEGGLGVNDLPSLGIGERFRSVLTSPNLFSEIHCTCEVVYVGAEGYTGLRFLHLPSEAQAAVVEYVNKFKNLAER